MASRKKVPGTERRTFTPANTDPAGNRRQRRATGRATTLDDKPLSRHTQRKRSKRVAGNQWRRRRDG